MAEHSNLVVAVLLLWTALALCCCTGCLFQKKKKRQKTIYSVAWTNKNRRWSEVHSLFKYLCQINQIMNAVGRQFTRFDAVLWGRCLKYTLSFGVLSMHVLILLRNYLLSTHLDKRNNLFFIEFTDYAIVLTSKTNFRWRSGQSFPDSCELSIYVTLTSR